MSDNLFNISVNNAIDEVFNQLDQMKVEDYVSQKERYRLLQYRRIDEMTEKMQDIIRNNSELFYDDRRISFGVSTQEKTADAAQKKNSEDVDRVISVLTGRGIEEKSIRTSDYSMYPQYDYSTNGEQKIVGYNVSTTLTIQDQDISEVGKLISACVAAGINNVDNISFLCSGFDEAYSKALSLAVETARKKAEVLAHAAGKTLGDPVVITEGYQNTSARYAKTANFSFDAVEESAAMGPALMPGETEITANVTVTYEMK